MATALHAASALARRDLRAALRQPGELLAPLGFALVVVALFPLGLAPDAALLRQLAPGLLWVVALLASLLALPRLFAADLADGTLEQWLLAPQPRALLVLAKLAVHWLLTGLPLVLLAPLLGLLLGLEQVGALALSLLLGTPLLSLLGALGAVLTLQARAGTGLLALLLLPLEVPVLVFGSAAAQPGSGAAPWYLLAALLAAGLALTPWACAAALSLTLD